MCTEINLRWLSLEYEHHLMQFYLWRYLSSLVFHTFPNLYISQTINPEWRMLLTLTFVWERSNLLKYCRTSEFVQMNSNLDSRFSSLRLALANNEFDIRRVLIIFFIMVATSSALSDVNIGFCIEYKQSRILHSEYLTVSK